MRGIFFILASLSQISILTRTTVYVSVLLREEIIVERRGIPRGFKFHSLLIKKIQKENFENLKKLLTHKECILTFSGNKVLAIELLEEGKFSKFKQLGKSGKTTSI